jgi:hypothetical protein
MVPQVSAEVLSTVLHSSRIIQPGEDQTHDREKTTHHHEFKTYPTSIEETEQET